MKVVTWALEVSSGGRGPGVNDLDDDGYTALDFALQECHIDIATLLVAEGGDASITNHDAYSILHSCGVDGHLRSIDFALAHGCKIDDVTLGVFIAHETRSREPHRRSSLPS